MFTSQWQMNSIRCWTWACVTPQRGAIFANGAHSASGRKSHLCIFNSHLIRFYIERDTRSPVSGTFLKSNWILGCLLCWNNKGAAWHSYSIFKSPLPLLCSWEDNYNSKSALLIRAALWGNPRPSSSRQLFGLSSALHPVDACQQPLRPINKHWWPAFPLCSLSLPVFLSLSRLPQCEDCSVLPAQHSD